MNMNMKVWEKLDEQCKYVSFSSVQHVQEP